MSLKVLVIPEDPTNNGYILKPLIEAILRDSGKGQAKVHVLTNPRLEGYDHAVKAIREELPGKYGFWDLWIFVPDADRATQGQMKALETEMKERNVTLLCARQFPKLKSMRALATGMNSGLAGRKRGHTRSSRNPFLIPSSNGLETSAQPGRAEQS